MIVTNIDGSGACYLRGASCTLNDNTNIKSYISVEANPQNTLQTITGTLTVTQPPVAPTTAPGTCTHKPTQNSIPASVTYCPTQTTFTACRADDRCYWNSCTILQSMASPETTSFAIASTTVTDVTRPFLDFTTSMTTQTNCEIIYTLEAGSDAALGFALS